MFGERVFSAGVCDNSQSYIQALIDWDLCIKDWDLVSGWYIKDSEIKFVFSENYGVSYEKTNRQFTFSYSITGTNDKFLLSSKLDFSIKIIQWVVHTRKYWYHAKI